MNRLVWLFLIALTAEAHVVVRYDSGFQRHVEWDGATRGSTLVDDPSAQEAIVIGGVEYSRFDRADFTERRVVDPEFGPSLELVVTGTVADRERLVNLERVTRVLLPDGFPQTALFRTRYRNRGERSLHVDRVYSQRVLLDRHLTEPSVQPYEFASFQGGAYKWGNEYAVIRLQPGFRQSNFQGVGDVRGAEGVGGGMPFIDAWSPVMGVALAHLEKAPAWLSLPVEVRPDQRVEMSVVEAPLAKFGQAEWLKPGDSFTTVLTAVMFHHLDSFDALGVYGQLLRRRGVAIPDSSSDYAHEPYWKSWGWMERFTLEKIYGILPELKSMDIRVANLDMGWFDHMGDWQILRTPGKFPNGEPDMIEFVRRLHAEGFRTSFWWYPLGVSTKSRLAAGHKDLLIQGEDGSYPLDNNDMYQLCPAHGPSLDHLRQVLTRAISVWGFDGAYTDYQGLSSVPACFNPAHHHQSPLDSFRASPRLFEMIHTTLRRLKPDSLHEVCICSLPHSPYNMPYYDLANASDPVSTWQVRSRVKVEKAIRGGTFPVGDCYQIPIQEWTGYSVPESFESAMGTGAQVTTFYTQLEEWQKGPWKRWFEDYRKMDLTRGEYLNLYDLAFDKPEGHVIRKGDTLYYGFFAGVWPRDRYKIELRGLKKDSSYEVYDYAHRVALGTVKGSDPRLNVAFKDSLLLRVRPVE